MIEPPRLKHGDLGAILRAADPAVTPERLASNAAGVKTLIAAGASTALWKLLVPLLVLLAIGVPVLVLRGGDREPSPVVAVAPADAELAMIEAQVAVVEAPPDAPPLVDDAPPAKRPVHVVVAPDAAPITLPTPPSDLPEQIRLYEGARDAAAHGDPARGVELVDELLRRFPATQLRAEAQLARADFLARAGKLADAAQALALLVDDPQHRGRRGELLRTLGDLYRRQGDCTSAIAAYNRALGERLGERDRKDAEHGRDRCTQR